MTKLHRRAHLTPGQVGHFGIESLIDQPVLFINLLKHLKFLCIGKSYEPCG